MSNAGEIWILYFTCGCVRWRNEFVQDDDVQCEHRDACVYARERKLVDRI